MSEYFRKPIVKILMLKGQEGQSIKSIEKTSTSGIVDTYTITLTDGRTSTFTVTNGGNGNEAEIEKINKALETNTNNIAKLKQHPTVILGTSWTQDPTNLYYTQTVSLSGITSNDNPPVDVVLSGTLADMQAQQEEWGKILKVETLTDTLKFYANEATTVSLTVIVKGV